MSPLATVKDHCCRKTWLLTCLPLLALTLTSLPPSQPPPPPKGAASTPHYTCNHGYLSRMACPALAVRLGWGGEDDTHRACALRERTGANMEVEKVFTKGIKQRALMSTKNMWTNFWWWCWWLLICLQLKNLKYNIVARSESCLQINVNHVQ